MSFRRGINALGARDSEILCYPNMEGDLDGDALYEALDKFEEEQQWCKPGIPSVNARYLNEDVLHAIFTAFTLEAKYCEEHKAKMFWLIYYGGHGASIDNTTSMILNTREGAWTFPIEHRIRLLCHTPYNFVIAVLDCCRT